MPRYDRRGTLPTTTRSCVCEDKPAAGCAELVDKLCRVDGDASKAIVKEKEGEYAVKFITASAA